MTYRNRRGSVTKTRSIRLRSQTEHWSSTVEGASAAEGSSHWVCVSGTRLLGDLGQPPCALAVAGSHPAAAARLSGTQRSGRLTTTSLIATRHPPSGRSVSCSVIRACAAGRIFASRTSSSPGTLRSTTRLVVDHRRPGADGVQNAGAGCGPVRVHRADPAVAHHPA